jgi:hypothetical protein
MAKKPRRDGKIQLLVDTLFDKIKVMASYNIN